MNREKNNYIIRQNNLLYNTWVYIAIIFSFPCLWKLCSFHFSPKILTWSWNRHISEIKTTIYCFITGGQKVTQYLGYVHVTLTSGYLSNWKRTSLSLWEASMFPIPEEECLYTGAVRWEEQAHTHTHTQTISPGHVWARINAAGHNLPSTRRGRERGGGIGTGCIGPAVRGWR